MSNLTLTKENYLKYLHQWRDAPKEFVEGLKSLCHVAPEFTHEPRMKIFEDGLSYESNYSYGKFTVRLRFVFFCLDGKKILDSWYDALVFDLESFGIKRATQGKIKNMCGGPPPWYDREGKLSQESRELVQEYLRLKYQLRYGERS